MSTTKTKQVPQKLQLCRDAFDYMVKKSKERIEKGGSIESEFSAIVFMPNEKSFTIVPVPLGDTVDAEQRREVMRITGEDLADQGAEAYVFLTIAEAWVSMKKFGSEAKRPIDDPKRKEAFLASAQDKTGAVKNISYQIKRKSGGVKLSRINLFGNSQVKNMYNWTNPKEDASIKIENSLTSEAWKVYKKKTKELKA